MAICASCHIGHVRRRMLVYTQWYDGQFIVVPNVSAWVCDHCGEKTFDSPLVAMLQNLLWVEPRHGWKEGGLFFASPEEVRWAIGARRGGE